MLYGNVNILFNLPSLKDRNDRNVNFHTFINNLYSIV